MKTIKCPCGQQIIVDDCNVTLINSLKLFCNGEQVGFRTNGKTGKVLAEILLEKREGFLIDHKDRNRHNFQLENLRYATPTQNNANCGPRKRNVLGVKGVSFRKRASKKYIAQIKTDGVVRTIGYFETLREAALAYNHEAKKAWGEFAYQNPI